MLDQREGCEICLNCGLVTDGQLIAEVDWGDGQGCTDNTERAGMLRMEALQDAAAAAAVAAAAPCSRSSGFAPRGGRRRNTSSSAIETTRCNDQLSEWCAAAHVHPSLAREATDICCKLLNLRPHADMAMRVVERNEMCAYSLYRACQNEDGCERSVREIVSACKHSVPIRRLWKVIARFQVDEKRSPHLGIADLVEGLWQRNGPDLNLSFQDVSQLRQMLMNAYGHGAHHPTTLCAALLWVYTKQRRILGGENLLPPQPRRTLIKICSVLNVSSTAVRRLSRSLEVEIFSRLLSTPPPPPPPPTARRSPSPARAQQ